MKVVKTIRFPVHPETTESKIEELDRLTPRLTFATNLFLDFIEKNDTIKLSDLNEYKNNFVKQRTGMNSAHLQQCYMKAREVWKSYKKKKGRKSKPRFKNRKIPIWQDHRTFEFIEWKEGKLTKYWVKLSTFIPYQRVMIPLDYGKYQEEQLETAEIKSCTIVKKGKRYYVHLSIQKQVKEKKPEKVLAVDLGIRRKVTAVLLSPSEKWSKEDIYILKNGKMKSLIHEYEQYYKKMQKLKKYDVLKRIRNKKETYKKGYDHILSKRIAEIADENDAKVVIGYPKNIRFSQRRGNGNKSLRKKVNSWSFHRIIKFIEYKCKEKGILVEIVRETWTSKACHRCGSKNTDRKIWSIIKCKDCGLEYNVDINACINIGSKAMPSESMGSCGRAITEDDNRKIRTQKLLPIGRSGSLEKYYYARYWIRSCRS